MGAGGECGLVAPVLKWAGGGAALFARRGVWRVMRSSGGYGLQSPTGAMLHRRIALALADDEETDWLDY